MTGTRAQPPLPAGCRLVCSLLALVTLLLYLPVRTHSFINYDDNVYLTENPIVRQGLSVEGFCWAFTSGYASNWHPLTWLSHMLDCQLFGLDPGPHHLVSVLFHVANAVLLCLWLTRATGLLWPAALAAALFAWHPLHTESVAWAAERKDVLSAFFGLLTLLAYTKYVHSGVRKWLWIAVGTFALGLMAKPMLVTLPCVLLLLDAWPLNRISLPVKPKDVRALILEKWPFFALTILSCAITFTVQRGGEAVVALENYPVQLRAVNILLAYVNYLRMTLWPSGLALPYPFAKLVTIEIIAGAFFLLTTLTWLVWRLRKSRPWWLMGWLWFLGMLVPVIGLVQVGAQAMADRYTYLPLVGLFLALGFEMRTLVQARPASQPGVTVGVGFILAACLLATSRQLSHWHDSITLFSHTLAVTQNNDLAHANLGAALEGEGKAAEARAHYESALAINPRHAISHNNLANVLLDAGDTAAALAHYQTAVTLDPDQPYFQLNLATLLARQGDFAAAMPHYNAAAKLRPHDPLPLYLMGLAEQQRNDSPAAITCYRNALLRDARDVQTLATLARLLASDPNQQVRNGTEAVRLAEQANALTRGDEPLILDTLAMAYAEAGRFDAAIKAAQQAIEAARKTEAKGMLPRLQQRLESFQSHRPWHETAADRQHPP